MQTGVARLLPDTDLSISYFGEGEVRALYVVDLRGTVFPFLSKWSPVYCHLMDGHSIPILEPVLDIVP